MESKAVKRQGVAADEQPLSCGRQTSAAQKLHLTFLRLCVLGVSEMTTILPRRVRNRASMPRGHRATMILFLSGIKRRQNLDRPRDQRPCTSYHSTRHRHTRILAFTASPSGTEIVVLRDCHHTTSVRFPLSHLGMTFEATNASLLSSRLHFTGLTNFRPSPPSWIRPRASS